MILILIISLFVLVAIALGLGALRNRSIRKKIERGELEEFPDIKQIEDMECCGQHQTCEKSAGCRKQAD